MLTGISENMVFPVKIQCGTNIEITPSIPV